MPQENHTANNAKKHATKPRTHKRGSGRERVLDAYATILKEDGPLAATLDEVARKADISKGGLLHHFGSKEALVEGLMERMDRLNAEDIKATMAHQNSGVIEYLQSSMRATDEYSETFMAVLKLAGSGNNTIDEGLQRTMAGWRDALDQAVPDPVLSRLIQLVGDGLYLHALVGTPADEIDQRVVERIQKLIEG